MYLLMKSNNLWKTVPLITSLLFCKKKITELNQTISHLRSIQKILINQQQDMDMLRSLDIAEISLVEKQSRYLVAVDMAENLSFEQEIERVIAETKNTNFAVCMTLPMVPCFQWSIYIKENSASIVPYILKCLFLFPKEDCICSLPEHT